jgi:hypothetical protein
MRSRSRVPVTWLALLISLYCTVAIAENKPLMRVHKFQNAPLNMHYFEGSDVESVRWKQSFLMHNNSSKDPMSNLITTSDTSSATHKLQRIRNLVVQCATAFGEIKSPEAAYNENVANIKGQMDEYFRRLGELRLFLLIIVTL